MRALATRIVCIAFLLSLAFGPNAGAQTFDTSGNNLLQGTSYFRQVIWIIGDNSGSLSRALAFYGTINFDGNGKYTIANAQIFDSDAGRVQTFSVTGTYSISASGFGYLSDPLSSGDSVYGLVSRGMFIGSSTESGNNDLFISAPLASPAPSNAALQGAYSMLDVDYSAGVPTGSRDSQFQLNADGNGNIAALQASGYIAARGTTPVSQNIPAFKYFFSNGGANLNFGGSLSSSNLIAGTKYLYLSADGEFVFGGSPTSFDMIVGVRSRGAAPAYGGLYYQTGVTQDESTLGNGFADLNTFYGSLKANAGVLLVHRRLLSVFDNNPIDSTYSDSYTLKPDGTYDDANNHFIFGAGGAIRLGIGKNPSIGISVALQAPSFNASGVFIDPTGVVNAASSALFTAGIAPGELISIYGVNLAAAPLSDPGFATTLGGVQVLVNGRPAPIYTVSPNQVSAVVPFGTTEPVAGIQVISNGIPSNTVTLFVNLTAPGVFTQPPGGIGYAAALHSDFSVVSPSNPAQAGETLSVFLTGLGAVNPAVADGVPGPSSPLSVVSNSIGVFIGGKQASSTFTGLAPQLIGLYQINVQVPAGVASGNAPLQVSGPDFVTAQAYIPIR
ncbi:MAG: hypothetical protein M3Z32_03200 [Acidobacteriota bacterium]|nr:hypothetical protein [Acidobacteriota bacterium]